VTLEKEEVESEQVQAISLCEDYLQKEARKQEEKIL